MLRFSALVLGAIVCIYSASPVNANEFPSTIQRCRYGDTECLKTTITDIFAQHPDGIPEIGLGSLDPFHIPISTMGSGEQRAGGPVHLNFTMTDIELTGWKKLTVKSVVGFEKDPRNSKFIIDTYVPIESLVGKYTVNGQILLLPISGSGRANITFENVDMKVTLRTSVRTSPDDHEDYLHVKSVTVAVNAKRMITDFSNLLNDKAISDNLNAVINENSDVLKQEFRPSIARSFRDHLNVFIPPIFEKFPYRMFFADGDTKGD